MYALSLKILKIPKLYICTCTMGVNNGIFGKTKFNSLMFILEYISSSSIMPGKYTQLVEKKITKSVIGLHKKVTSIITIPAK